MNPAISKNLNSTVLKTLNITLRNKIVLPFSSIWYIPLMDLNKHQQCFLLGPVFIKKTSSYRYMNPHYKHKTFWWSSRGYNGDPIPIRQRLFSIDVLLQQLPLVQYFGKRYSAVMIDSKYHTKAHGCPHEADSDTTVCINNLNLFQTKYSQHCVSDTKSVHFSWNRQCMQNKYIFIMWYTRIQNCLFYKNSIYNNEVETICKNANCIECLANFFLLIFSPLWKFEVNCVSAHKATCKLSLTI